MLSRIVISVLTMIAPAPAVALVSGSAASAHEQRTVGQYEKEVGFFEEPALVNQLNGVFLSVAKEGKPVEGLAVTLKVELIIGGGAASKELAFEPIEGEAGSYVAQFLPTLARGLRLPHLWRN